MNPQNKNKKGAKAEWQTVPQRRRNTQKGPSPSPAVPRSRRHSSDSSSSEVTTSTGSSSTVTVRPADDTTEEHLSPDQLQSIAINIHAKSWKRVFRDLMASYTRKPSVDVMIGDIEKNNQGDVVEQKYQALCKWQSVMEAEATLEKLKMTLKKHGCWDEDEAPASPIAMSKSTPEHPASARPKEKVEKPQITWDGKQLSIQRGTDTQHIPLQGRLNGGGQQISDPSRIADAMLVSFINPNQTQHKYEMELDELEGRFREKYGKNMFRDLGMRGMKSFIRQRSKLLILTQKDQKCVVQEKKNESETVVDEDLSDSGSEVESELGVFETASEMSSTCASPTYMCQEEETPWQLPKKSPRAKKQKQSFTETETPYRKYCQRIGADELTQLVRRCEGDLLVLRTEEDYVSEKGSQIFTKDVVSLWNTPRKSNDDAYIIVGIKSASSPPHDLSGLTQPSKVNEDYQEKFMKASFSCMPQFLYYEVEYSDKIFGVVCVANGAGYGDVCWAVETCSNGEWCQNDILHRNGKVINPANRKDQDAIFRWFHKGSGKKDSVASNEGEEAWKEFLEQLDVENHQRRNYCLLVSRCSSGTNNLSTLAHFPWVKVWDFDPDSRESGLLAMCEADLQDRLFVRTWRDPPQAPLSNSFTEWFFVQGLRNREDSLVLGTVKEWSREVGKFLDAECNQLSKLCEKRPLTVVVLWYNSRDYVRHLQRTLFKIDECASGITYIICMHQFPDDEGGRRVMSEVCTQLEISRIIEIPLERLCFGLLSVSCCQKHLKGSHNLPGGAVINSRDSQWLKQELDVLYNDEFSTEASSSQGEAFLKGGNLTWQEIDLGAYDARRTIGLEVNAHLQRQLLKGFSGTVYLFHEPGAGGTTLGRRILWDLHTLYPCVCAISDVIDPPEIYSRLELLYQRTHLPILLLVDGQESRLVKELLEMSQNIHMVILNVQRYAMEIRNKTHYGNRFWLKGEVDTKEAVQFDRVFSEKCSGGKRQKLTEMVKDVEDKGAAHYVYEFGLTVYSIEYTGLRSYVSGYLDIREKELTNWQRAVGYLALASYYGHTSIPCQFFSMLFGKKESEIVEADEVLTHSGKQFVLEDPGKCTWRITYHAVAKEILEQILGGRQNESKGTSPRLSTKARRNLKEFAKEFLTYASMKQQRSKSGPSSAVMRILRGIFIHRDYKETGQDEHNKRERLSRIICDIPSSTTSSDQLELMEHLVACFPEDPTCVSHLGRAHMIFTQDFDLAKKHLVKAKDLRMRERKTNRDKYSRMSPDKTSEVNSESDSILCTIYHNLGNLCHEQLKELIGGGKLGDDKEYKCSPGELNSMLRKVYQYASTAVDHFIRCRHHRTKGMDASYGYIGEIKVRLHVADFVESRNKPGGYYGFLTAEHNDGDIQDFVESCFSCTSSLLDEYQDLVTPAEQAEVKELDTCQNWFSVLFRDADTALKFWQGKEDVESNRSKIAVYKLKHQKDLRGKAVVRRTPAQIVNGITSAEDVKNIVQLYEGIFKDAYLRNIRIDISNNLRDWMVAIRHYLFQPTIYSIAEKVLPQVEKCYQISQSSVTALYYLYVLNTTLALLTQQKMYLAESIRLREKLKKVHSKMDRLYRIFAWEWLGSDKNDSTIRRVVHRSCLGVWDSEKRFWRDESAHGKLQVCKGVITDCKIPNHGHISITTGGSSVGHRSGSLRAVYVPRQCGLFGKNYLNTEVEFYIGFNIENGIEAYGVLELKKYPCSHCKITVSVSRLEKPCRKVCERCGHAVRIPEDSGS